MAAFDLWTPFSDQMVVTPLRVLVAGGQNEYIWQAWATLEARVGKASQARKVRDPALCCIVSLSACHLFARCLAKCLQRALCC